MTDLFVLTWKAEVMDGADSACVTLIIEGLPKNVCLDDLESQALPAFVAATYDLWGWRFIVQTLHNEGATRYDLKCSVSGHPDLNEQMLKAIAGGVLEAMLARLEKQSPELIDAVEVAIARKCEDGGAVRIRWRNPLACTTLTKLDELVTDMTALYVLAEIRRVWARRRGYTNAAGYWAIVRDRAERRLNSVE